MARVVAVNDKNIRKIKLTHSMVSNKNDCIWIGREGGGEGGRRRGLRL